MTFLDSGVVIIVLQWLHVLLGIFWFGSQMYLDVTVRPAAAKLDPAAQAEFGRHTGRGLARQITLFVATGTIVTGILGGIAVGVLGRLDTPYGQTWLAALAIGTFMMMSVWTRGFGARAIAMRFGY